MPRTYPFSFLPQRMNRMARVGVPKATNIVMKGVSLAIGRAAVQATRVDTGKARSNWRASLNLPDRAVIGPYAPGHKLGRGETANATGAKAQQRSVINVFNSKRDKSIYITNYVDYIEKLNNGSAATGSADNMLAKATQAGRAAFLTIKLINKL